jgi:predicted naringenin-chalcone synthase
MPLPKADSVLYIVLEGLQSDGVKLILMFMGCLGFRKGFCCWFNYNGNYSVLILIIFLISVTLQVADGLIKNLIQWVLPSHNNNKKA